MEPDDLMAAERRAEENCRAFYSVPGNFERIADACTYAAERATVLGFEHGVLPSGEVIGLYTYQSVERGALEVHPEWMDAVAIFEPGAELNT